jgi:hypothetical protein
MAGNQQTNHHHLTIFTTATAVPVHLCFCSSLQLKPASTKFPITKIIILTEPS